jgi:DNA polymerase III alpha subunit (gram-positive type)
MNHYIFFDLETSTEANKALNGIGAVIQLAAVAVTVDTLKVVDTLERKILFREKEADKWILDLVHYDPKVWEEEGRPAWDVLQEFAKFTNRFCWYPRQRRGNEIYHAILAGHNVSKFDIPVLLNWEKRLHDYYRPDRYTPIAASYSPSLDTLSLAQSWSFKNDLWFPNYKLKNLCDYFEVELTNWHEALSDVYASVNLAKKLKF